MASSVVMCSGCKGAGQRSVVSNEAAQRTGIEQVPADTVAVRCTVCGGSGYRPITRKAVAELAQWLTVPVG